MAPAPTLTPTADPTPSALAATGIDPGILLLAGVYLILGGLIAWGLHYKKRHEGGAR